MRANQFIPLGLLILGVTMVVSAQFYKSGEEAGRLEGIKTGRLEALDTMRHEAQMYFLNCTADNCRAERTASRAFEARANELINQVSAK